MVIEPTNIQILNDVQQGEHLHTKHIHTEYKLDIIVFFFVLFIICIFSYML